MYRNPLIALLAGLMLFIFAAGSAAEPYQKQEQRYGQESDWSVLLGALVMRKPEYEGAEDYEFRGFPVVDITWREKYFFNPRKGLGAYVWSRDDMKVGLSIGYTFGRDDDDSSDLDGLGDIDGGVTGNILFTRNIDDFSLDARFEQQFAGEDTGFQIHVGLGYIIRYGKKMLFKPSVKTSYASSGYAEKYFSISPGQSSRSGLPLYDADPGFKSAGLTILSIYSLNRHWGVQALAAYDRLLGDTADSPVVKDGNQYRAGLGISYRF